MPKKNQKIVGMKIDAFNEAVKQKEISVRQAKLIPPIIKPGNEIALTSIFLSSLKLIKEFRDDIFADLNLRKSGMHYYFTEASFYDNKESRPDGLILSVVSDQIHDAVILEVKNKHTDIDDKQIQKYVDLCKGIGINKILTISNQFVSDPTKSICRDIKIPKSIELYHFSWSYILTLAQLLLFNNDHNIADEDQKLLMKEIVDFFEAKESGIMDFNKMKAGWKEVAKKFTSGSLPQKDDPLTEETIQSWYQEEKDMSLKLSKQLGVLVKTTSRKDQKARWEGDLQSLINKKLLTTKLKVEGAVSPLEIVAHFERKTITMLVQVKAPATKTVRGQIGWLRKQLNKCQNKDQDKFSILKDNLHFQPILKYRNEYPVTKIERIDDVIEDLKGKEITDFEISYIMHLGTKFENPSKFVDIIEEMLINYYSGVVQYLENAPNKSPQMKKEEKIEEIAIETEQTK